MKKLLAVAVALCIAVPSTFASFDYFSVIEGGKGQATGGYYGNGGGGGGFGLKIRYGLMESLELYSSVGSAGLEYNLSGTMSTNYVLGARYQIMDLLSAFLDVGMPTMANTDHHYLGIVPGVNVTTNITDQFSIGSVLQLGIVFTDTTVNKRGDKTNSPVMNLKIGVEGDYQVSETVCLWLALDYVMLAMTTDKRGDYFSSSNPDDAFQPSLGASFSNGDFGVGTFIGLSFAHPVYKKGQNDKSEVDNGVGFSGGIEFTLGF